MGVLTGVVVPSLTPACYNMGIEKHLVELVVVPSLTPACYNNEPISDSDYRSCSSLSHPGVL